MGHDWHNGRWLTLWATKWKTLARLLSSPVSLWGLVLVTGDICPTMPTSCANASSRQWWQSVVSPSSKLTTWSGLMLHGWYPTLITYTSAQSTAALYSQRQSCWQGAQGWQYLSTLGIKSMEGHLRCNFKDCNISALVYLNLDKQGFC